MEKCASVVKKVEKKNAYTRNYEATFPFVTSLRDHVRSVLTNGVLMDNI